MPIRQFHLGLLAFWTIHFGGQALAAARALPIDVAGRAGGLGAAHYLGLASFAVAALFLLSLLVRLVGVVHEQGDADFYAGAGLAGGLVLTAIGGVADMPAWSGDGIAASMASATALMVSAVALSLPSSIARPISPATEAAAGPGTDLVSKRARQAAMMAGLTRSTGKGPAR
jgi:hypothetical protein